MVWLDGRWGRFYQVQKAKRTRIRHELGLSLCLTRVDFCPVSLAGGRAPGWLDRTLWFWGCLGMWGRWLVTWGKDKGPRSVACIFQHPWWAMGGSQEGREGPGRKSEWGWVLRLEGHTVWGRGAALETRVSPLQILDP